MRVTGRTAMIKETKLPFAALAGSAALAAAFVLTQSAADAESKKDAPQLKQNPPSAASPQIAPSTLNLAEIKVFKPATVQPKVTGSPSRIPLKFIPLSAGD